MKGALASFYKQIMRRYLYLLQDANDGIVV